MKLKKKTTLSIAVLVLAASVLFYTTLPVSAHSMPSEQFDTIVGNIATKLNMKPEDVRAVFEEVQKEKQAEHLARFTVRLDELVKSGKLTDPQKQSLLAKEQEMTESRPQNHDTVMNMSAEERKAYMQKQKDELSSWAKDQGISQETLKEIGFGGMHMFKKGFGEREPR